MIESDDPRPSVLVLAPTRELAIQIVEETCCRSPRRRALSVAAVYGGAGIQPQIKARAPRPHLVATPGRLEDLLDRARGVSSARSASWSSTRPTGCSTWASARRSTASSRKLPRKRQTLFFSATLDGDVGRLARVYTTDARSHEQAPAAERRGDVKHRFVWVTHDTKLDALVRELRDDQRGLTLVFVRTKRGADRLVKRLRAHDVEALAMHGNKSQSQREKALARFESGRVDTLVATDVAARGLRHRRHHARDQLRRSGRPRRATCTGSGRTGRAGRRGVGVTFVEHEQAMTSTASLRILSLEKEFAAAGIRTAPPHRSARPRRRGGARRRTR